MLNTNHNSTCVRVLNISKYTSVDNSKFRKRLFTAIYFATLFIHNYIFYKSLLYLKSVIRTYKRSRRLRRKHKRTLLFRFMHRSVYTITQNLSKTIIYLSRMTKEYSLISGNKLLSKRALKIIGSIRNWRGQKNFFKKKKTVGIVIASMFSFLAKKKQRVLKNVHNYSHISAFFYLVSKVGFSMVDLKSIFKVTEQYECSLLDVRKILLLRVFDFVSYRVGKEPSPSTIFFVNGTRINILKYILRVGDLISIVEEPFTSNGVAPWILFFLVLSYGNKLFLFHLCISFIFSIFALFFDANILHLQNDFFQKLSLDFIRPPVVKDDIFLQESDNKVLTVDLPLLSIMESSYFKKKIIQRVLRHKSYLILFMSRIFYVKKRYKSLYMLVSHNIFFSRSTLNKYWNTIVQVFYTIPFCISDYNIVNNSREVLWNSFTQLFPIMLDGDILSWRSASNTSNFLILNIVSSRTVPFLYTSKTKPAWAYKAPFRFFSL